MFKSLSVHERASLLGDAVYGANDGIITTFAIVSGAMGASLGVSVILTLGFANLLADGISMASGNYLGVKSEIDYEKGNSKKGKSQHSPMRHATITFVAFVFAGLIPLIPFVLGLENSFYTSALFVAIALFVVGAVTASITKKSIIKGGLEVLVIGGIAATVAYLVGFIIDNYIV